MRHWLTGFALVALALALAVPAARGQGGTVSQSYLQTFDGSPAAPGPYRPPGWDVQIHSRDPATWDALETADMFGAPVLADHGPACEAPPAQHDPTGDYPSHVFQCHDHVMTHIKADGYGVIYLTPPALLDWSQGDATLQWDMSTLRTSSRDWVDVWLTPYADRLALPLETDFPVDLAGAPPTNLHLQMSSFNGESTWTLASTLAGVVSNLGPSWGFTWPGIESTVGSPSAVRRDTFKLTVRDGHVTLGMPGYATTWIDNDTPPLGFTQAVVQFGHHSYFPQKGCDGLPAGSLCPADTWHWDNVSLSPAAPISIMELGPRMLTDAAPGGWAFPAPALPDTTLQFSADNAPADVPSIDLSWDSGLTWQTVLPAPSSAPGNATNHARSYRVDVPVGATRVEVRGAGGWWGATWRAKDASLWRATVPDLPPTATPAPAATATAQASITPLPPSVTPTDLPTAIPPTLTPGATATPAPTSTALPVATATSAASCLARIPSNNPRVTLCVEMAP